MLTRGNDKLQMMVVDSYCLGRAGEWQMCTTLRGGRCDTSVAERGSKSETSACEVMRMCDFESVEGSSDGIELICWIFWGVLSDCRLVLYEVSESSFLAF